MKVNTIFKEDCVEGMRKLPSCSIQVIVTSPPYNMNKKYKSYNDKVSWDKYYQFLLRVFVESHRILKNEGLLFLNVSNSIVNQFKAYELANLLKIIGFNLVDTVVWYKINPQPNRSTRLLMNSYEFVFVFSKTKDYYFNKRNIAVPCKHSDKLKCRGNLWSFNPVRKNQFSILKHCAMFPEDLPILCILLGSKYDDLVLDPFMGSGTTAVAAKKLGRRFIGFEISEEYVNMCNQRLQGVEK